MIEIDFNKRTYVCPYCGCKQAYATNADFGTAGYNMYIEKRNENVRMYDIDIITIKCANGKCQRITVVAKNDAFKRQWDLIPDNVVKKFPDYIPEQIRNDYEEASSIIQLSPKASATLFRRCLQGMIHDFWNIHEKNLNAEITALKGNVSDSQWKAIDAIRKVGNIGAHMEHDVNCIIEIDSDEASKFQKLIEVLIDNWYIARHDEESLYDDIVTIADNKEQERK